MQGLYSHVETFRNFNLRITFYFVFGEHVHKYQSAFFEKGWRYYSIYNTMNFVLFLKQSQIESRTIHHIFTSMFGRQKFICFVSRIFDSFCLWPLKKKKNFGPLFDREKHFLIQMNKAIKIVSKLLVGQIFAIAFFRLVSDFS